MSSDCVSQSSIASARVIGQLQMGTVLRGRYEIRSLLGKGAMGEVYGAFDRELEVAVALKLLRPEIVRQPEVVERFRREVRLGRAITHRNVCRVYDLCSAADGEAGPRLLLSMELLEGETFESYLRRHGRLEPRSLLAVFGQIAAGLAAAHDVGVVHRDLKTSNLVLVADRVVITDFGLAWSEVVDGGRTNTLTGAGQIVGSPAYLAPEQLLGEPVGPHSDVYSFGVMLYEAATGVRPFVGETAFATAMRRLEVEPVPPSLQLRQRLEKDEAADTGPEAVPSDAATTAMSIAGPSFFGQPGGSKSGLAEAGELGSRVGMSRSSGVDEASSPGPPPVAVAVDVDGDRAFPAEWDEIILRCLARNPEERYADAVSVVEALETAFDHAVALSPGSFPSQAAKGDVGPSAPALAPALAPARWAGWSRGWIGRLPRRRVWLLPVLVLLALGLLPWSFSGSGFVSLVPRGDPAPSADRRADRAPTVASSRAEPQHDARSADAEAADAEAADAEAADAEAADERGAGQRAVERQDWVAARAHFERALERAPDDARARLDLAGAWWQLGYRARALEVVAALPEPTDAVPHTERLRQKIRRAELEDRWSAVTEGLRELRARVPGEDELGLRLVAAELRAGRPEAAEAVVEELARSRSRDGRLELLRAEIEGSRGRYEAQGEAAVRAREWAKTHDARGVYGRALTQLGASWLSRGQYAAAAEAFEAARRRFGELGDLRRRAEAERKLGVVHQRRGEWDRAETLYLRSLATFQELGDRRSEATVQNDLGTLLGHSGRSADADRAYDAALGLMREVGYVRGEAVVLLNRGTPHFWRGDFVEARESFAAAIPLLESVGDSFARDTAELDLANVEWRSGDLAAARARLESLARRHLQEGSTDYLAAAIYHDLGSVLADTLGLTAREWLERAYQLRTDLEEHESALDSRLALVELTLGDALQPGAASADRAILVARRPARVELASAGPGGFASFADRAGAACAELLGSSMASGLSARTRARWLRVTAQCLHRRGESAQARARLDQAFEGGVELPPWEDVANRVWRARWSASDDEAAPLETLAARCDARGWPVDAMRARMAAADLRGDGESLAGLAHDARSRGWLRLASEADRVWMTRGAPSTEPGGGRR